jgi:hypothetical protein
MVEQTSGVLQAAVRNLRQAVIRVVRTSTNDVDRRNGERYPTDLRGEMSIGSAQRHAVTVADISVSGASLRSSFKGVAGNKGVLYVEGMTIAFVVHSLHDAGMGVAFMIEAPARAQLERLITRVRMQRAA